MDISTSQANAAAEEKTKKASARPPSLTVREVFSSYSYLLAIAQSVGSYQKDKPSVIEYSTRGKWSDLFPGHPRISGTICVGTSKSPRNRMYIFTMPQLKALEIINELRCTHCRVIFLFMKKTWENSVEYEKRKIPGCFKKIRRKQREYDWNCIKIPGVSR